MLTNHGIQDCNECILEHCSIQIHEDAPILANTMSFQRFESLNARRVQTACRNRLCGGEDEAMYLFGGIEVSVNKYQCSGMLADYKNTEGRAA